MKALFIGAFKLVTTLLIIMALIMLLQTILMVSGIGFKVAGIFSGTISFLINIIIPFLVSVGLGVGLMTLFDLNVKLAISAGFIAGLSHFLLGWDPSKTNFMNIIIIIMFLNIIASCLVAMITNRFVLRKKLIHEKSE